MRAALAVAAAAVVLVPGAAASRRAHALFTPGHTLPNATVGVDYKEVYLRGGRGLWEQEPCPGAGPNTFTPCTAMAPRGMELQRRSTDDESIDAIRLAGTPQQAGTFTLTFNWNVDGEKVTNSWTLVVEPSKKKPAKLRVKITGDDGVPLDDSTNYHVLVYNDGTESARDVTVHISHGDGVEIVHAVHAEQGRCETIGRRIGCSLGTVAPSRNATFITFTLRFTAPGTSRLTADARSPTGNQHVTSSLEIYGQRTADLAVTLQAPPSASPGAVVQWIAEVSNNGPDTTTATVTMAPAERLVNGKRLVVFERVSSTRSRCRLIGGALDCRFTHFAKDDRVKITVRGRIADDARAGNVNQLIAVQTRDHDPSAPNRDVQGTRVVP